MNPQKLVLRLFSILVCFSFACSLTATPQAPVPTATISPPIAIPSATQLPPTPTPIPPLPAEVKIGVIYPLTGRLADVNNWGGEGEPFWEAAGVDINKLPEAEAKGVHFSLVVRTSDSTGEGALAAAQDLVEKEGVKAIAGLPTSGELRGSIEYLSQNNIAAISSASTGPNPELMLADTIYRIMPTELYRARKLADLALYLGYSKAAIIYRTDGWGDPFAAEFATQFAAKGYPTRQVAIKPTHPNVQDYAAEVSDLSGKVAELGADEHTVVVMAVWEGEDLNILHHAAADKTLSGVRWLSGLAGPSLLTGEFGNSGMSLPDAPSFAFNHKLWSLESHPESNDLIRRLWNEAKSELGREPRFEHVYMYDAVQLMARAILLAGTLDGTAIASNIPAAAQDYQPATGIIRFDQNGDRISGDLDYYGSFKVGANYEYRYYAYFYDDAAGGHFEILTSPQPRNVEFCPEC
jgi:ABC-type branched-subunit amino acid transport system substrate-binding protein